MISGLILAAGSSSRLGRPKQLLELDGRPLLQHVIDALVASPVGEVVVVLGHEAPRIEAALDLSGARVVVNPEYLSGQASSLAAGLGALDGRSEAAAIFLGDQPRLTRTLIESALDAFTSTRRPIVQARFGDVPGHPVVVARSEWQSFMTLDGDRGARDLLLGSPERVEVIELGDSPLDDIDTWADYRDLAGAPDP